MMINSGIVISIKDMLLINSFCISELVSMLLMHLAALVNVVIWDLRIIRSFVLEGTSGDLWPNLLTKKRADYKSD